MPLSDSVPTRDALRSDLGTLKKLTESLIEDSRFEDRQRARAWVRLTEMLVDYADRERECFGTVHSPIRYLLYDARAEREQLEKTLGADFIRLNLRTAWGELEALTTEEYLDEVQAARPRFQAALLAGDESAAWKILEATVAVIAEMDDNTYEPEDQSTHARPMGDRLAPHFPEEMTLAQHVARFGGTGAPVGRPRHGTKKPEQAQRKILERCPGRSIDELRACLGRGRKSAAASVVRRELAAAVAEILDGRKATREALAEALSCGSLRTIDALRRDGRDDRRIVA